jgi:hypothetical protein
MPASAPVRRDWKTVAGSLVGCTIGAYHWLHWHTSAGLFLLCLAGSALLLALLAPRLWAPLGSAVERLIALLLRALTWLLLLLLFIAVFIPGRLLLLLLRRDPLQRRCEPGRPSYWEPLPARSTRHFEQPY